MGCITLKGYARGCDDNSYAGIESVILFEKSGVTNYALDADGQLSGLTLASTFNAYKYDFLKDNSNFSSAPQGGAGVSISWLQTLTMIFRKNSLGLVTEVNNLSKNYLVAIVKDNNGEYWTLGLERGLELAPSAGAVTGNNLTEQNNMTVVFTGTEKVPMLNTDISTGSAIDAKILALFGF